MQFSISTTGCVLSSKLEDNQGNHLLHCKIASSGEHQNKDALILRIELSCNDGDFPFSWN